MGLRSCICSGSYVCLMRKGPERRTYANPASWRSFWCCTSCWTTAYQSRRASRSIDSWQPHPGSQRSSQSTVATISRDRLVVVLQLYDRELSAAFSPATIWCAIFGADLRADAGRHRGRAAHGHVCSMETVRTIPLRLVHAAVESGGRSASSMHRAMNIQSSALGIALAFFGVIQLGRPGPIDHPRPTPGEPEPMTTHGATS